MSPEVTVDLRDVRFTSESGRQTRQPASRLRAKLGNRKHTSVRAAAYAVPNSFVTAHLSRRRNSPSVRRQIKAHKPWVRVMSKFDSIASPTVRAADNLEPSFVHEDQIRVAKHKLSDHLARRKKRPNVLIYMMDDVGWGDFGCYGGGIAVGAPTPNFDKLARGGLQLTSCYSEPSCSPSRATLQTGRARRRTAGF